MVKKKNVPVKAKAAKKQSSDDAYLLKLIMYLIISSQWILITREMSWQIPIPYGALVALLFARHEHFRTDRRIEYAVILVAMFVGFWVPAGLTFMV